MSTPDEAQEWVAKAEEDYAGAVALKRSRKSPLSNLVCFHAQQCAEKYLKAFLISRQATFPKIHDLVNLLDLCVSQEPAFEALRNICISLDPFSVLIRYPGHDASPEEAADALKAVRKLRLLLRSWLKDP